MLMVPLINIDCLPQIYQSEGYTGQSEGYKLINDLVSYNMYNSRIIYSFFFFKSNQPCVEFSSDYTCTT